MLSNFEQFWNECEGDIERQRRLLSLILERVYVDGQNVKAITLKSDYHFVLGHNANEPTYTEVDPKDYVWAQRDLDAHIIPSGIYFLPDHLHVRSISLAIFP